MSQPPPNGPPQPPVPPCRRALLEGIIDYAGLFPPAALPMEEALRRFLGHRGSDDGWLLARFVCPTARFEELETLLETLETGASPVRISALGRGGESLEQFKNGVEQDARAIRRFEARNGTRAVIDAFETKLPAAGGVASAVEHVSRQLVDTTGPTVACFLEDSLLGDWRPRLPAAASAVRDAKRAAGGAGRIGLKIRCGGADAAAVPEPFAVAAAIATCRSIGVPLKATQGLHHAFRQHDDDLGTDVHGFLNLFLAAVMAHAHDLPVTRLTEMIAEHDPKKFSFSDYSIGWRDHGADPDAVATAREALLTGFGSCSFAEPRDELKALALID